MCPRAEYPYSDSWPVEGFAMDEANFVQIRIAPAYDWWEVRLCFRPGRDTGRYRPEFPIYAEVRSEKTGRPVKQRNVSQCIARFKTEAEAQLFVHKMHQSKQKKVFFDEFSE